MYLNPQDVNYNVYYNDIKENICNGNDFEVYGYPKDMRYKTSLCVGLTVDYVVNDELWVFSEFNYTKAVTADKIIFKINKNYGSSYIITDDELLKGDIIGEENRSMINAGVKFLIGEGYGRFYIESGLSFNSVYVRKAEIVLRNDNNGYERNYDIYNREDSYYNYKQGGLGNGLFVGLGYYLSLSDKYWVELGLTNYMVKIKLKEPYMYKGEYCFYVRLGFR